MVRILLSGNDIITSSTDILCFYCRITRHDIEEESKELFLNTLFYSELKNSVEAANKFFKNSSRRKAIDIMDKEVIVIPVHEDAHWSLVIILDPSSPLNNSGLTSIVHLDSAGCHNSKQIARNLRPLLNHEAAILSNSSIGCLYTEDTSPLVKPAGKGEN